MPGYPRQYGIHCSLLELEQQLLADFQKRYGGRLTIQQLLDNDEESARFCDTVLAERGYKAPRFFLLATLRGAYKASNV